MTSESDLRDLAPTTPSRDPAGGAPSPTADDQILAEVREILIGPQLRALDERFGRVEKMVLTHNSRLLKLLDRRIAVVEELVKSRISRLQEKLDAQDHAIDDLDTRLLDQSRALRAEFDALDASLKQQLSALQATLDAETAALREGARSHDRDLAKLFQEMAARLLDGNPDR